MAVFVIRIYTYICCTLVQHVPAICSKLTQAGSVGMQAWGQGRGRQRERRNSQTGASSCGWCAVETATLGSSRRRASHSRVSVGGGMPVHVICIFRIVSLHRQ